MTTENTPKKKKKREIGLLRIMPLSFAIGFSAPVIFLGAMLILIHTGAWCVPLFLSYLALLIMPTSYWVSRRDLNNQHFILGDELFYTEYPDEMKKAVRRMRRKGTPGERHDRAEQYRSEPVPEFREENPAFIKERRKGRLLFLAAAVLLTALAAWLFVQANHIWWVNHNLGRKQPDLSWIFPLAGGVLVLVTALLAWFRKKNRWLYLAAQLVLLFGAWGAYVSVSVNARLVLADVLKGFGCAVLYALIWFGPLHFARDLRSREEAYRVYAEQQIELFELGCFDEDVLRIRLEKRRQAG